LYWTDYVARRALPSFAVVRASPRPSPARTARPSHTYKVSEERWTAEAVGAPQKMEAEGRGLSQQEGKKDR